MIKNNLNYIGIWYRQGCFKLYSYRRYLYIKKVTLLKVIYERVFYYEFKLDNNLATGL